MALQFVCFCFSLCYIFLDFNTFVRSLARDVGGLCRSVGWTSGKIHGCECESGLSECLS